MVGRYSHHTAHRVDLPDKMAFRRPANRRIAGKIGDCIQCQSKQHRFGAEPRSRHSGLYSGVAAADHRYIIAFHLITHILNISLPYIG